LIATAPPPPPEVVKDILWFWANLCGEGLVVRNYLLQLGVVNTVADYLILNWGVDHCLATSAWLMERLCSGLPLPDFRAIEPILPVIWHMLEYSIVNQDNEMQIDLLKLLTNLLGFDVNLLQNTLSRDLLTALMKSGDQPYTRGLSEYCLRFFVNLTNVSDRHCIILEDMGFVDFLENRLRLNSSDEAHLSEIFKCLTNVLFGTHQLVQVLLQRPYVCEMVKAALASSVYVVEVEAMFLVANAFYFAKSFEDIVAVANLDESHELLYWITGRDPELSEIIVTALNQVIDMVFILGNDSEVERDKIVDFANVWFLSNEMSDILSAYMQNEISPKAYKTATELADRIDSLKKIFEMTEQAIMSSIREIVHTKYEF
jgi:hypothetical protein